MIMIVDGVVSGGRMMIENVTEIMLQLMMRQQERRGCETMF